MNESDDSDRAQDGERPGKTRTWWHPLLVRLLDFELAAAYKVQEEVLVGKLPLRVDILLIRRESGELPEANRRVHRITGGPFTTWLVETDVMAELGDPILSLVSRVFLNQHRRIMEQLTQTGRPALLCYTLQQIEQFRKMGEGFIMTHADTQYMNELEDELQLVLAGISPERRLRGLPPEERLRGLPREERLRGLTPEELAGGLTEEQAARLRELLDRGRDG